MFTKSLVTCLLLCAILDPIQCGVLKKKRAILEAERHRQIGGRVTLTTKEFLVNELLMKLKADDYAEHNDAAFLASKKFTEVRTKIEESKLFKYIQKIPKGAAVHTHLFNAKSLDFIFENPREDLHVCDGKQLTLRFLPEGHNNTGCEWKQYATLLKNNSGYADYLKSKLSVETITKSKIKYVNKAITGLLTHKLTFKEYINQVLKHYKEDNIQHVQFRGDLFELYDTDGSLWNELESFSILNTTLSEDNVDLPSVKFIYVPIKKGNYLKRIKTTFHEIYKTFPNVILGLDIHNLDKAEQEQVKGFFAGRSMRYFSEGGKSNWYGLEGDTDIIDAFLSGSSRIGHAFSLQVHPELMKMVKENNVAIEVCPISDQLHGLVADFRNHPAVGYIANGLPMIIANDKPSMWGVGGLSHDWYVTFMAMTKNDTGLAFFKELALNSMHHSALEGFEKDRLLRGFYKKWDEYVEEAQAMIEVLKMFG